MRRPPVPPFDHDSAVAKVRAEEDAWNRRDPDLVAEAYAVQTEWRSRDEFLTGRQAVKDFLRRKWEIELHYRMRNELWCYTGNRISVRFEYEWQHAVTGQWYRTHGNEHCEFDARGYMTFRDMSANDIPIQSSDRRLS